MTDRSHEAVCTDDVVPVSKAHQLEKQMREPEWMPKYKMMKVEILKGEASRDLGEAA